VKNKKVTYLLLTTVALVWGLIVYRIVAGMSDDTKVKPNNKKKEVSLYTEEKEVYPLLLNYSDPFLKGGRGIGTGITEQSAANVYASTGTIRHKKVLAKKEVKPVVVPAVIDWSFIHYIGLIGNNSNANKIGLVNIHAHEHIVKEKDMIGDVSIIRLSKDTLRVTFNNVEHFLLRGK
jgi:hypothetical protein